MHFMPTCCRHRQQQRRAPWLLQHLQPALHDSRPARQRLPPWWPRQPCPRLQRQQGWRRRRREWRPAPHQAAPTAPCAPPHWRPFCPRCYRRLRGGRPSPCHGCGCGVSAWRSRGGGGPNCGCGCGRGDCCGESATSARGCGCGSGGPGCDCGCGYAGCGCGCACGGMSGGSVSATSGGESASASVSDGERSGVTTRPRGPEGLQRRLLERPQAQGRGPAQRRAKPQQQQGHQRRGQRAALQRMASRAERPWQPRRRSPAQFHAGQRIDRQTDRQQRAGCVSATGQTSEF